MEYSELELKTRKNSMNTWAPLFSKIVDSSIWLEPDFVVKVFITMLAKKDSDQVVRGSAFNISQWAKKTEKETLEALKILAAPDTKRLEPQPFEGRRVEKVDDGWLILNGQAYEEMMRKVNRREYKRIKQQEYRKKKKPAGLPGEGVAVAAMDRGDDATAEAIAAERKPRRNSVPHGTKGAAVSTEEVPGLSGGSEAMPASISEPEEGEEPPTSDALQPAPFEP